MKFKKTIATLLSTIFLMGLFATSAFAAIPFCERESNNTQATANDFDVENDNTTIVYGTGNSNDAKDFFKGWFSKKEYTSLKANARFQGAPGCTYLFTVYDSDMREWGHGTSTSGSDVEINDLLIQIKKPWYFEVELLQGTPTQPYRFYIQGLDAY